MIKMALNTTPGEKKQRRERWGGEGKRQERRGNRVRHVCLCGMTSLCTAAVFVNQGRPGVFAGLVLSEEGGKRGRTKSKKEKGSCGSEQ